MSFTISESVMVVAYFDDKESIPYTNSLLLQSTASPYAPMIGMAVAAGVDQANRIANRHFSPLEQFILGLVEIIGGGFFIQSPRSEMRAISHGLLAAGSGQIVNTVWA